MHPYEKIPLDVAGIALGIWLIVLHAWMLWKSKGSKDFLQKLPRNRVLGPWLLGIGMTWFWLLIAPERLGVLSSLHMDLGEFNKAKPILRILVPIAAYGMIVHVKEFLTVRAIGLLALMAAAPLLYAAYLEPPASRLLVPIFAYVMIFKGLFWVGMPYTMRDAITWALKSNDRYVMLSIGGLCYGLAVMACALIWW
ncbi:hypothetical protein JO972_14600 [Verrucomicrobiaceae bacterium 5K15]|uniref:Uncharacterized protein n=1 Tax=Oceaniferula flava TaxID=2800421 RepID=A0AAE2VA31_9BACT|nr:hypothetical protein [Oceaniferula flavus]MBK1856198.1 hypothetical protein [Oceaniferula flavus]MBM1137505.1 hypothetical protein [Oceaniferula flavus]